MILLIRKRVICVCVCASTTHACIILLNKIKKQATILVCEVSRIFFFGSSPFFFLSLPIIFPSTLRIIHLEYKISI